MCGIAGWNANTLDPFFESSENARRLASNLLWEIDSRGKDACGWSWIDSKNNRTRTWKKNVDAAVVWEKYYHRLPGATTTAIFHTRYATQGLASNNANNHPIIHGRVVGVHNGMIQNDNQLFRTNKMSRYAEVDSEAIFALLSRTKDQGLAVPAALATIEGSMAIAWMDRRVQLQANGASTLNLARGSSSPLALASNAHGSLVFASTLALLVGACEAAKFDIENAYVVNEGTFLQVTNGRVETCLTFEANSGWNSKYKYNDWSTSGIGKNAVKGTYVTPTVLGPKDVKGLVKNSMKDTRGYTAEMYVDLWEKLAEDDESLLMSEGTSNLYPSERTPTRVEQDAEFWERQRLQDAEWSEEDKAFALAMGREDR